MYYSVIIPLYNKEKHIARAIASVLNQTYQNFELIVVDDGSTDNSLRIAKSFKDNRITVITRDRPGPGGYKARNTGVRASHGNWIAFLDADDEWNKDFLTRISELHEQFPKAGILSSGWINVYIGGGRKPDPYYMQYFEKGNRAYNIKDYLKWSVPGIRPICTSVAVIDKDVFMKAGMFPESGIGRGGDVDTWFRIMMSGTIGAWCAFTGAVYYRDSDNMITQSVAPSISGNHLLKSIRMFLKNESDPALRNLLIKYRRAIYRSVVKTKSEVYFIKLIRLSAGRNLSDKLIKMIVSFTKNTKKQHT